MALLVITMSPTQVGEQPSRMSFDFDARTAEQRAVYLRRLSEGTYRSRWASLLDSGGGEVCRIDLSRLQKVEVEPDPAGLRCPG